MAYTVFYSWQSDLPNNTNKNFIEGCIKSALKKIKSSNPFFIELNVDRDTKNKTGTPDIVETIFQKIDNSQIFVADISIINSNSEGRRCPNPNVLLELGYASKTLGWDKIICVYNLDYGTYDDLPFDLRLKRPLCYRLNNCSKEESKKGMVNAIYNSIFSLYQQGKITNEINDYIKMQVDTEILTIINIFIKILYGYKEFTFKDINDFLELKQKEIEDLLEKKILLFTVDKSFKNIQEKLELLFEKIGSSLLYDKEMGFPLVNLISWVAHYRKFTSERESPNIYIHTNMFDENYKPVLGSDINPENGEGYLLIKKIDNETGMVVDFGNFGGKREGLNEYIRINEIYIRHYSTMITECIALIVNWLKTTHKEFVINNTFDFEIRKKTDGIFDGEKIKYSEEILNFISCTNFEINYYDLLSINFFNYLWKYGFIFNIQNELEEYIKKSTKYSISCTNYEIVSVNTENSCRYCKEKFEQAKNENLIIINEIYLDENSYRNYMILLKCSKMTELPVEIREKLSSIITIYQKNLTLHLKQIVSELLVEIFNNKESIKENIVGLYYEKFLNTKIGYKNDYRELKKSLYDCMKSTLRDSP